MTLIQRLVERFLTKTPDGKVILHAGCGPFYPGPGIISTKHDFLGRPYEVALDGRKIKENEFHLCFEPFKPFHEKFVQRRLKWIEKRKNVIPINGGFAEHFSTPNMPGEEFKDAEKNVKTSKARSKELNDAIADEIHLHNLINWEDMTDQSRRAIISEASRLVKNEGHIYVSSLWAPHPVSEKKTRTARRRSKTQGRIPGTAR